MTLIRSSLPSTKINNRITKQNGLFFRNFPTEVPPIHMLILETEAGVPLPTSVTQIQSTLKVEGAYRLPIPAPLAENMQLSYNHNTSPLNDAISSARAAAQSAGTINGADLIGANLIGTALGVTFNGLKNVTLEQPEFRKHQFSWKLSPRNSTESTTLQKLLFSLKKGMHPGQLLGARISLTFPKVYVIAFKPSPVYMYKFKPMVLESLEVDYLGGNPTPAFFGELKEHAVPESVSVRMTFLEIGYWTRPDLGEGDLPSDDPFDTDPFYKVDIPGGGL